MLTGEVEVKLATYLWLHPWQFILTGCTATDILESGEVSTPLWGRRERSKVCHNDDTVSNFSALVKLNERTRPVRMPEGAKEACVAFFAVDMAAQQLGSAEWQASSCEARSGTSSDGDGEGCAQVHELRCRGEEVERVKAAIPTTAAMKGNSDLEAALSGRSTRLPRASAEDTSGSQEFHRMSLSELKMHVETSLKSGIRFGHIAASLRVHRNTLRRYMMKDGSWGGVYDKSPLPDVCDQLREVVPLQEDGACWGIRKCQAALRATNHRVSRRKVRAALYSLDSAALQLRRVKRAKGDSTSRLSTGEVEARKQLHEGRMTLSPAVLDETQSLLHSARTAETGATQQSVINPVATIGWSRAIGHLVGKEPSSSSRIRENRSAAATSGDHAVMNSEVERHNSCMVDVGATDLEHLDGQAVHHGRKVVVQGISDGVAETDKRLSGNNLRDSLCRSGLSENDLLSGSEDGQSGIEVVPSSRLSTDEPPRATVGRDASLRSHNLGAEAVGKHGEMQVLQEGTRPEDFGTESNCGWRFSATTSNRRENVCQDNRMATMEVRSPSFEKDADVAEVPVRKRWFPHADEFKLNDEEGSLKSREILEKLDSFLAAGRRKKIENVVENRTYTICLVLENLLEQGNITTVCNAADAFGFQSVHLISNCLKHRYKKPRKAFIGVEKWLDVETWDTSRECVAALRNRGYRIAVTHDAADSISVHDLDWTVPTAVILGNESRGPSHEAILSSDIRCSIPTVGMEDALSVPVVAGILMQHVVWSRLKQTGVHGDLLPDEQQILAAEFCMRHSR